MKPLLSYTRSEQIVEAAFVHGALPTCKKDCRKTLRHNSHVYTAYEYPTFAFNRIPARMQGRAKPPACHKQGQAIVVSGMTNTVCNATRHNLTRKISQARYSTVSSFRPWGVSLSGLRLQLKLQMPFPQRVRIYYHYGIRSPKPQTLIKNGLLRPNSILVVVFLDLCVLPDRTTFPGRIEVACTCPVKTASLDAYSPGTSNPKP